jgi:hypothetical protein
MKAQKYFMCAVMWCLGMGATFAQNINVPFIDSQCNYRLDKDAQDRLVTNFLITEDGK